jgi:putative sterol carrier protein
MKRVIAAAVMAGVSAAAGAAPVMMSAQWVQGLCAAWNADPGLTTQLVESEWIRNDKGRGYKVMQVYREDCPASPRVELKVALRDGKAQCVAAGPAATPLDGGADYVMWAETKRWQEMGRGEYGPMRAMFFNRLKFDGPMGEAMGNMGPFEGFLLLVGKVPGDTASCPPK